MKEYDKDFQKKLATEISVAPKGAAVPMAMEDYALVRDQIKAGCQ